MNRQWHGGIWISSFWNFNHFVDTLPITISNWSFLFLHQHILSYNRCYHFRFSVIFLFEIQKLYLSMLKELLEIVWNMKFPYCWMGMCLEARTIFFYLAIAMTEFLLQAIHSIHLAIVKHDVLCFLLWQLQIQVIKTMMQQCWNWLWF